MQGFRLRLVAEPDHLDDVSHKLLSEYQALRKCYWGQHLWARGYWVASSGNVTDEIWKQYIEDQKPEEPDDNFKAV